jgi:predicted small lipoprotein YifL
MKQLIDNILIILSLVFVTGCGTLEKVAPSQNKVLNSVTNSNMGKEKSYFMQKQLDYFLNKKFTPIVNRDKSIQKKYMDKIVDKETGQISYKDRESDDFTLQEIFDKVNVYMKDKPSNGKESHVNKIDTLPVIGTTKKR